MFTKMKKLIITRKPEEEIKRVQIYGYVPKCVVDYIDNIAILTCKSRSEVIRNILPSTKDEWSKYINMQIKVDDVTDDYSYRTVNAFVTEFNFAKIKRNTKYPINYSITQGLTQKVLYMIKKSNEVPKPNKKYTHIHIYTTKERSELLEQARVLFNMNNKTKYSKSRFIIRMLNGATDVGTWGIEEDYDDTRKSIVSLIFSDEDVELFKMRYGTKPTEKFCKDLLEYMFV
jgi:hypothetical protein